MEFVGDNYKYFSKLKKDKIKRIRKSEKVNERKAQNPISSIEKPKDDISNQLNKFNKGNIIFT